MRCEILTEVLVRIQVFRNLQLCLGVNGSLFLDSKILESLDMS